MLKKSLTTLILIVLVALPLNAAFEAQKVEAAVWATAEVPLSPLSIAAKISAAANTNTALGIDALVAKEVGLGGVFSLDGIAWMLINIILHKMSQSMITWINSGFKGSPTFVQDIDRFLLDIGDKVAGGFIWGSDLRFLCAPFQLDVRLALDQQYRNSRGGSSYAQRSQCTLSGVVENMDDFLNGNFIAGGWNGWFTLTQNPVNNPYGQIVLAQTELSKRLTEKKGSEMKTLDFGKGFLSMKTCEMSDYYDDTDAAATAQEVCSITTPGTAIEAQLNKTLGSGQDRVQVADEINELIAALFYQLAEKAFSGAGGLLGLTKSGYGGGSGTYYDQLAADGQAMLAVATSSQNTSGTSGTSGTSNNGDPGMWTGYWKPEGMTPTVLVADQSGTKGAGNITYFPGCLNQQDTLGSCKSRNSIKAYDLLGSYDLNDKKIVSIRYKTGTVLDADSSASLSISNPVGANIPYGQEMGLRVSLSETPGNFSVDGKCQSGGGGTPYIILASEQYVNQKPNSACPLKSNTIYYLNLQAQNGCTFDNLNYCKFKIDESSFFAYDPLADTPQNTTAAVCSPHYSYSIDSDFQRFFDSGVTHHINISPDSVLALEFVPGKSDDGDFTFAAKSGATSQFISECPGQITNTCKGTNYSRTGAPANEFIPACNIGDDRTKTWYFNIYNTSETRTISIQMKNRTFKSTE